LTNTLQGTQTQRDVQENYFFRPLTKPS